ncbi:flagellin [Acetobacterium sp.]|uniref:flagellin N-terminal helical domain-containing protein n=1 Tax=Acetobacterium sp. TaxID=1872094 RepID=UPI002F3FBD98
MRINHNIAALNTYNKLAANQATTSKSLEKLSSGLKINKAGDDAAGLAISEKMRGQIRGLDQATANASDGISLIKTAEGGLNETHSILQRMRELSVQSANDTNTADDRAEIQKEVNQLGEEIDRISNTTQFNTKNLLDGSMGKGVAADVANVNTNTAIGAATSGGKFSALTDADGNSLGIQSGDKIEISYVINGQTKTASTSGGATLKVGFDKMLGASGATYSGAAGVHLAATTDGFTGAANGITITVTDSNDVVRAGATNALSSFSETTAAADQRADGQSTLQIGANTGQNIQVDIENMGSAALGVENLQVGNQGQANVAIKVIDAATQKVSAERSKLGSVQNRLEHTINNLGASSENATAAESRIRDVDMAKEMMEFTKNNILSQAAQSMLAQANQQPQGVLQLLQ